MRRKMVMVPRCRSRTFVTLVSASTLAISGPGKRNPGLRFHFEMFHILKMSHIRKAVLTFQG